MPSTRAEYLTSRYFNNTITAAEQEELALLVLQLEDDGIKPLLENAWEHHVPDASLPDAATDTMLHLFFSQQHGENRSAKALHIATVDLTDDSNQKTGAAEATPVIQMQATEKQRRSVPLLLKLLGAVAVVVAIFLLAVQPADNSIKPVIKTFTAAAGERKNFQLPDGSIVTLNSSSNITISNQYGVSGRDIYLQGEAFFDVKHNKSLPFIVHTGTMDVKALGTAFNVKAYPGETVTEASLLRGSVEVTLTKEQNRKVVLSPDQKIQYKMITAAAPKPGKAVTATEIITEPALVSSLSKTEKGDIKETAWKENKLVFTDESFTNIAVLLERWYGVKVNFADTATGNYRFTGIFEREELESVLSILKESRPFKYKVTKGEIINVKLFK